MNAPTERTQYEKHLRKAVYERFSTAFFREKRDVQRIWIALILSKIPTRELENLLRQFDEYADKQP